VEFYARSGESALNRFILRQSKKISQRAKLLFFCTLPQSQRTLINEQASRTHEQARMRMSPLAGRPLKILKKTPRKHPKKAFVFANLLCLFY
jgi:hypothetical protein